MPNIDLVKVVIIIVLILAVLGTAVAFVTLYQTALGKGAEYIDMSMTQTGAENEHALTGRDMVTQFSNAAFGWNAAQPGGLLGVLVPASSALVALLLLLWLIVWLRRVFS